IAHVGHEFLRELPVAEIAPALFGPASPGAEMDLVDRYRRPAIVALVAPRHPVLVAPGMARGRRDDRGRARRPLRLRRVRIGLERQEGAVMAEDLVLVGFARRDAGQKDFP